MSVLRIALAALVTDQATKALALAGLTWGTPVAVMPALNLTLGLNTGASFGMLSGIMAERPLPMALGTGLLTFGFAIMALRTRDPLERGGLALIVGGAAGNILDRLRQGAVTDFLDLYWRDWHWPAFNFADVAIVCGAALTLASHFVLSRKHGKTDA